MLLLVFVLVGLCLTALLMFVIVGLCLNALLVFVLVGLCLNASVGVCSCRFVFECLY